MKRLSSKKFKLPRKVLRECNTVNHISVPRKLRSAMKKRSPESASLPLPDYKNPQPGEECNKKLRRNDNLEKETITKDEADAVETLISLAEMFPNSNKNNGFKCESKETKSPSGHRFVHLKPLQKLGEGCVYQTITDLAMHAPENEEQSVSSMNSKQHVHEEVEASERSPEIEVAISAAVGSLLERNLTIHNSQNIGLWPGLSSVISLGTDDKGLPMKNASKTQPNSSMDDTLTSEVFGELVATNKSGKRCIAHVRISRLIKDLQAAGKMKNNPMQLLNQSIENEKQKQEAHIHKSVSKIGFSTSFAEKEQNETRNAISLPKRLLQDQTPTLHASNKQGFDFLSLLSNGEGVEDSKTATKTGNLMEPWAQFHIPYLQSINQNQINTPFPMPQSRYSTPPLTDYIPVTTAKQVRVQMQSHSSLGPTQLGHPSSPAQLQQRVWASQFASQYKPMGHNNPNMQSRKLDPPISIPFSQSLELLHPMYIPMFPQQGHNLVPLPSSLPISRAKTPRHC